MMEKICEACGNAHDGSYGSGRFCSHKCQATYAAKNATERAAYCKTIRAQLKQTQIDNMVCVCEKCGITYIRKDGVSARFCSRRCSNSRKHTEQTKEKISSGVKRRLVVYQGNDAHIKRCNKCNRILSANNLLGYCQECLSRMFKCKKCGAPITKQSKLGYCAKCAHSDPDVREKHRLAQNSLVQRGLHKGWAVRNKRSYAEKFFERVLAENHISFETEKRVGPYFLDFVIGNIDLEIDGKQHKYKDRKEHDDDRDEYLRSCGYFVYRIAWNSINNESGKAMMKDKIDLFIDWYDAYTRMNID